MWLSIRDQAGNILGQEDLIHTSWIVTERGFENTAEITIVVERSGTIFQGVINHDDGSAAAVVQLPTGALNQGAEIDFEPGALVIFGKHTSSS